MTAGVPITGGNVNAIEKITRRILVLLLAIAEAVTYPYTTLGQIHMRRGFSGMFIPKKGSREQLNILKMFERGNAEPYAASFAELVAKILGISDLQGKKSLKETSRVKYITGETSEYEWGPRNRGRNEVEIDSQHPITDAMKANLAYKIATTIVAHKYGMPLGEAIDYIYEVFSESVEKAKGMRTAAPGENTKDIYISTAKELAKKWGIPEEHGEKIGELIVKIGSILEGAIPPEKDIEKYAKKELNERIEKYKHHETRTPYGILADMFPELETIITNKSNDIRALAEELEQISPFKEKKPAPKPLPVLDAKLEVLSIPNGLEFAGYSEEAKKRALEMLSRKIAELSAEKPTAERIFELGLYAFAAEVIRSGNPERIRELREL